VAMESKPFPQMDKILRRCGHGKILTHSSRPGPQEVVGDGDEHQMDR